MLFLVYESFSSQLISLLTGLNAMTLTLPARDVYSQYPLIVRFVWVASSGAVRGL